MKKSILFLMAILIFACTKSNIQGYRITNLGGSDLTITTPEGNYTIETTKSIFFVSKERDYQNLTYRFEDEHLKIKLLSLATSPEKHIHVSSYRYDFRIEVVGLADSVEITINGISFNESIPFEYGTDNVPAFYEIYSNPNIKNDNVFTIVSHNGYAIDYFRHTNRAANLSGRINK